MSNIKIIFVDIDDTLNPANKRVSAYTKDVMKRIKDKGIKIVVNTGRSIGYAILKSKEAGLSEYVIGSNGAEIFNYETGECLFNKEIPANELKSIYEYVQEHKMTIIFNCLEKRYINTKEYSYNDEPVIYFDDIDELLAKEEVNQAIILSSNYDRMLIIPNLFKEKYPDLRIVHSSINLVEQKRVKDKELYHDIVALNTAKSSGIVELLDYLHIDSSEAIAIGNGYDDICMCDVVGTSIAVGNAIDDLKEVADYVTDTSANDGVAKILEELCLKD